MNRRRAFSNDSLLNVSPGHRLVRPKRHCYCGGEGLGLSSPFRISLRRPSGQQHVVLSDGLPFASDRNEGFRHGTHCLRLRPILRAFDSTLALGAKQRHMAGFKRALMSGIGICAGLLIALLTIWALCRTRRMQKIAASGSQTMCPACGLITSRLKERCLECHQPLRSAQVTLTVDK